MAAGLLDAGMARRRACGRDLPSFLGAMWGPVGRGGPRGPFSGVWSGGTKSTPQAPVGAEPGERGSAAIRGPGWGSGTSRNAKVVL